MKKFVPIILLLIAACREQGANEQTESQVQDNFLSEIGNASAPQDDARLQQLIDRAMPAVLPDADKAQYQGVRAGVGGSVCGRVAPVAKGKPGPYRPFVITPDAVAILGEAGEIKFNDPSDFLADAWIRWCASTDELKLVETQLDEGPPLTAEPLPGGELPAMPVEEPLPAAKQAPPRRTATKPPPPPQIDSFSQSISRPE